MFSSLDAVALPPDFLDRADYIATLDLRDVFSDWTGVTLFPDDDWRKPPRPDWKELLRAFVTEAVVRVMRPRCTGRVRPTAVSALVGRARNRILYYFERQRLGHPELRGSIQTQLAIDGQWNGQLVERERRFAGRLELRCRGVPAAAVRRANGRPASCTVVIDLRTKKRRRW